MQYIFISIFSLTIAYHLFCFRKIDFYSISSLSLVAYFFPLIFHNFEKSNEVYGISSIPFLINLFFCLIWDLLNRNKNISVDTIKYKSVGSNFSSFLLFLTIISFLLLIYSTNLSTFLLSKTEQSYNVHIYGIFISFFSIGFLYSFVYCRKILIYFIIILMLLFISGDRTALVILIFSCAMLFLGKYPISLISKLLKYTFLIPFTLILFIGLYGKVLYSSIVLSISNDENFLTVFFTIVKSKSLYEVVSMSEPFHTFGMLVKVVENQFHIDSSYLLELPFHFLPISGPFTDTLHHFSTEIKNNFYSSWSTNAGVSSNFWAEGYAVFGLYGVIIFSLFYSIFIFIFNYLNNKISVFYQPLIIIAGVFFSFYIQRNSLFQIMSHEKRIIYGFILSYLLFTVYKNLLKLRI